MWVVGNVCSNLLDCKTMLTFFTQTALCLPSPCLPLSLLLFSPQSSDSAIVNGVYPQQPLGIWVFWYFNRCVGGNHNSNQPNVFGLSDSSCSNISAMDTPWGRKSGINFSSFCYNMSSGHTASCGSLTLSARVCFYQEEMDRWPDSITTNLNINWNRCQNEEFNMQKLKNASDVAFSVSCSRSVFKT